MAILEWDEGLRVGIKTIDGQHQQLIALINDLQDSVAQGTGSLKISYVLQELIRYSSYHFDEEERLMQLHGFPGLAAHRQEHDFFVLKLKVIQEKYGDRDELSQSTLEFLKDWILFHIKGTDQKYGEFISRSHME